MFERPPSELCEVVLPNDDELCKDSLVELQPGNDVTHNEIPDYHNQQNTCVQTEIVVRYFNLLQGSIKSLTIITLYCFLLSIIYDFLFCHSW